jgi:hypothetical protein
MSDKWDWAWQADLWIGCLFSAPDVNGGEKMGID